MVYLFQKQTRLETEPLCIGFKWNEVSKGTQTMREWKAFALSKQMSKKNIAICNWAERIVDIMGACKRCYQIIKTLRSYKKYIWHLHWSHSENFRFKAIDKGLFVSRGTKYSETDTVAQSWMFADCDCWIVTNRAFFLGIFVTFGDHLWAMTAGKICDILQFLLFFSASMCLWYLHHLFLL